MNSNVFCIKSIIFWYMLTTGIACKKISSTPFIRNNLIKSNSQNFGGGSSLASMFWDIDSVLKKQLSMFTSSNLESNLSTLGLSIVNAYSPKILPSSASHFTTFTSSSSKNEVKEGPFSYQSMFTDSTSIFSFPMNKGDIVIYLDLQNNSPRYLELYAIRGLYCDREVIENIYSIITPNFYKNVIIPPYHHITVKFAFKPLLEMESTKGMLQIGLEYFKISDDAKQNYEALTRNSPSSSSPSKNKRNRKFRKRGSMTRSAPFSKPIEFEEIVVNGTDWQVLFVLFMLSGLVIGAVIGIYKWISDRKKGNGSHRKRSR